ncbi:unnamed protein product [Caenorhabditis brenneri]
MSLSRPVEFPLLKLPWLCMKCVFHNSDELDLIYFATISNRTRKIVQHSKFPLKVIDIHLNAFKQISSGDQKAWRLTRHWYEGGVPLVLQRNSQPLPTSRHFDSCRGHHLQTSTTGDKVDALKMAIEFIIDVFGCTIGQVIVDGNKLSDLIGLGISSAKQLRMKDAEPVNITDLKFLLENIKVTDEYVFSAPIPANFSCDPQIFKCRKMYFGFSSSADWVTSEMLCQFDVAQLHFSDHRFSFADIVSYINYWFNSENRKLEYLHIAFNNRISLEDLKIDHLNPMPFCEKRRNRCPLNESWWGKTDMSSGKDIFRQDGLLATLHAFPTSIIFYIWHKRFPDAVEHN